MKRLSICCATILLLSVYVQAAHAQAVSMWAQDQPGSISTTDYTGNKLTFVCERGYYDVYLTTQDNIAETYHWLNVSLWASRLQRIELRATVTDYNELRMRLNESEEMYNLITNLNDRYDLTILVKANKRDEIFQFSLDGFADRFITLCAV